MTKQRPDHHRHSSSHTCENNHHRPMNVPPTPPSIEPSKAHHGHTEIITKSGDMDTLPGLSRDHHAPEPHSDLMNTPAPDTINTPPTSTSSASQQPSSSTEVSSLPPPPATLPPKPPTITLSPSKEDDEPRFEEPLLLCQKAYEPSKPHPTQDLFGLYGLTPLAAGVARRDLTTGAKINPMRKTYAGQIKGFQLAGKNKAAPHGEGGVGMSLSEMIMWPEPEWHNQKLSGRDISKGFSAAVQAKLEKAMKLEPGSVPKNDEWESLLGIEKVKHAPAPSTEGSKSKHTASTFKPTRPPAQVNGVRSHTDAEINRPKRAGKRRRYNDDSFEGYGDGFDDNDIPDDGGYSSGEGSRRGGSSKKRRKDYAPINSPITSGGVGGYAAGLMGQGHVGRGIGAYGGR